MPSGIVIALLIFSILFLLIHAISGSEEAFIIGTRLFLVCAILAMAVDIMEVIKTQNQQFFYSIIGFFLGVAILLLLPQNLQSEYLMLGVIFFFNLIDIARRKLKKALVYYFTGLSLFSTFYILAIFSEELFVPLFIAGLCVYGSLFYLGLRA